MSKPTIRIVIIDDHAVVRKGLVMVLRLEPDFDVVGEAGNAFDGVQLVRALKPNVILLDRVIPGSDVVETIKKLKRVSPDSRIMVLTGTDLDAHVLSILRIGVDGYVLKEIEPQELKHAIRVIYEGDAFLQPQVTRHVIDFLTKEDSGRDLLTNRELEVLDWMASTATYREIGKQLSVSEETIRSHAKHIISKLGQTNRGAAVSEGIRLGLIKKSL